MSQEKTLGIVRHSANDSEKVDYLYRVSLKCLIRNEQGEVLVVKENGRQWWDLPGGGMDHGESLRLAIAREMKEEVNLEGDFTYSIIDIDEAFLLDRDIWQLRLVFMVMPESFLFSPGEDGDAIAFIHPDDFRHSSSEVERRIYRYHLASQRG